MSFTEDKWNNKWYVQPETTNSGFNCFYIQKEATYSGLQNTNYWYKSKLQAESNLNLSSTGTGNIFWSSQINQI